MSSLLTVSLIAFYVLLAVLCALEKKWPMCLYWIGATVVTTAAWWMSLRIPMEILK